MYSHGTNAKRSTLATAAMLAVAVLLSACDRDTSDLDRYMEDVKARPATEIEPIPRVQTFERVTYAPQGRRDPFTPDQRSAGLMGLIEETTEPPPGHDRAREPLEDFPLDSLRMVGTLELGGTRWALIRATDGVVHRVREGNHMGSNYGRVVDITESRIQLQEQVPDGTGGWMERSASMSLAE